MSARVREPVETFCPRRRSVTFIAASPFPNPPAAFPLHDVHRRQHFFADSSSALFHKLCATVSRPPCLDRLGKASSNQLARGVVTGPTRGRREIQTKNKQANVVRCVLPSIPSHQPLELTRRPRCLMYHSTITPFLYLFLFSCVCSE